jgi:aldehyde:ferredoxin oxidoreductase
MHDPKFDFGYGASYLGDPTPARHTLWSPGKSSRFPDAPGPPEDRSQSRGWGRKEKHAGESAHVMNASGMCSFIYSMAPTERIPQWINLVTGWDTTHEEVQLVGERIANLRLAFALKHGNNPAARTMPGRMRGDPPQPIGPHRGKTLDADRMRSEWFEAAGWDPETALPSRAKLEALGLADVADALGITE